MDEASLSKNFGIQLFGRICAAIIGVLSIAILTRSLGAEGFGEYTTATTFLQFFAVVVDFGLTLTLIVMISEKNAAIEKIVANIYTLRIVSSVIVFTIAPITILFLPWSKEVQQGVLVGAFGYVLVSAAMLLTGIFQRYRSMWRASIAEVINRIVLFGLLLVFSWLDLGMVWMIGAGTVANAVWLFMMIRFAKPFVTIRFDADWTLWKTILSRSWPIAVSIFFNLLYLRGDVLFLAYFRNQTEVGLYGVAYRLIDVLTTLPVMFMGLLLPMAVAEWTSGNKDRFREYVSKTFDLFMIATIPIIFGTQAIGNTLIFAVAGPGYEGSGRVLQVLILAMLGIFLGALFGHLVVAINKQKQMTFGYIIVAIISMAGYFWLVPLFGMWGAVIVTLVSESLIALITYMVVHKTANLHLNLDVTLKAIGASFLMYLVLRALPNLPLILELCLAFLVYFTLMIQMKAIKIDDIALIVNERTDV